MSESKVSPHNLAELKNTTDDALQNYVRSLGFAQDNTKLDVRLAIGYASVIIAIAAFAADYKLQWEQTKTWMPVAVVAYALLNGAFTYWIWAVEKGIVFEGTRAGGKLAIVSKTNKHDPTYYLTVTVTPAGSSSPSTWHIKSPLTTWFTADGFFVARPFQQWLASSVEMIGDADLKNAGRDERDDLAAPSAGVHRIVDASGNGSVGTSGADVQGKGTPRGKKKA
ncbi:hypothetical protein LTR62_005028 [Meristemomyces frigidus]|uniref:Signal peptidase complex subunit 2 n=1 Tax=Meristemomyces frigidus TaxID=1508187 RepID=A0AAN7TPA2_9PEZI|nr:hypothetical protein LTR62_005028 [Meristemomyces frigidus]